MKLLITLLALTMPGLVNAAYSTPNGEDAGNNTVQLIEYHDFDNQYDTSTDFIAAGSVIPEGMRVHAIRTDNNRRSVILFNVRTHFLYPSGKLYVSTGVLEALGVTSGTEVVLEMIE